MTTKEFLQQYRDTDLAIDAKLDEIRHLRALAAKATQILPTEKGQAAPEEGNRKAAAAKIAELETETAAMADRLSLLKHQIESAIGKVPNPKQRAVLTHRYLCGQTWEQTAEALDLSYQWVNTLHTRALDTLSKMIPKS